MSPFGTFVCYLGELRCKPRRNAGAHVIAEVRHAEPEPKRGNRLKKTEV